MQCPEKMVVNCLGVEEKTIAKRIAAAKEHLATSCSMNA